MWAALAAVALLWTYWGTLGSYLRDQHYQEHFLYLWVFFGLALTKSLRGPFRRRFGLTSRRDRFGLVLVVSACFALAASEAVGSSVVARASLVLFVTGISLCVVAAWSAGRCLMHGLLMQFCFGLPYQVYFPLTEKLQLGVAAMLAIPCKLGLAGYVVQANAVRFPDYELVVTPDCAGIGQLLTFCGIAALGVLSSARNGRRTVRLLALAVVLAWLSNLARVSVFVLLVGLGVHRVIEDPTWHSLLGFVVFLPFVFLLVRTILRTHQPLPRAEDAAPPAGRIPIAWLVVPVVLIHAALNRSEDALPEPAYYQALQQPPGYQLELHGGSEANDRAVYGTPWLLNARFRDAAGTWFDLLHYATRSHSHLCVHRIATCLAVPGQEVRYDSAVVVDGRPWWRIDLDRPGEEDYHVYFAFEIDGQRHDDSAATQFEVFRQRLIGGTWEVRLSRVMFPGRLPAQPSAKEGEVLAWLGRLTATAP